MKSVQFESVLSQILHLEYLVSELKLLSEILFELALGRKRCSLDSLVKISLYKIPFESVLSQTMYWVSGL